MKKGAFMDGSPDLKAPEARVKGCQAESPRSMIHLPVLTVLLPPVCPAHDFIFFKMSGAARNAMTSMGYWVSQYLYASSRAGAREETESPPRGTKSPPGQPREARDW